MHCDFRGASQNNNVHLQLTLEVMQFIKDDACSNGLSNANHQNEPN